MQSVIGQPPRAGPGSVRPAQTRHASFATWLAVVQRKLQQARMRGKGCLAFFAACLRPGSACAYTMLVASDIKKDIHGVEP
jgi:hypothetical protein